MILLIIVDERRQEHQLSGLAATAAQDTKQQNVVLLGTKGS
jgi:hypothetical protein